MDNQAVIRATKFRGLVAWHQPEIFLISSTAQGSQVTHVEIFFTLIH